MRRMLAGGRNAIVAAAARAGCATVIKDSAKPCRCIVATSAFSCRRQMCRMLAGGSYAVMAAAASTGDASVIKACAKPCIGSMTKVTFLSCLGMCRMFAGGGNAIMTAAAGTYHRCMVDSADTGEADCVMAIFTGGDHSDMCRGHAHGHRIVVAGLTGGEDTAVVESCASPCFRGVAIIAKIAADDMFCVLARCTTVVVAQGAFHGCAFELSAYVTAGTVDKFVFTG